MRRVMLTILLTFGLLVARESHALTTADLKYAGRDYTAASIQAGFVSSINAILAEPATAAAAIENLSDYGVYQLATQYEYAGGNISLLEAKLEPAGVLDLFVSKLLSAEESGAAATMAVRIKAYPAPSVYMTLEEIYLEFATATSTSVTAAQAIGYTTLYAGSNLLAAFWTGFSIGAAFNDLMQEWNPDFDYDVATAFIDGVDAAESQGLPLALESVEPLAYDIYEWTL